jgi:thiosulfate reductase cytochrome b subunit
VQLKERRVTIREKHPLFIRWTHWINFPILTLMVWSGLLIYWANRTYWPPLPEGFFSFLGLEHQLSKGLSYHFFLMWIFAINGFLYAVYLLFSGVWREIIPQRHFFRDSIRVIRYEMGVKGITLPDTKFNAAQRVVYSGVIVMGFLFLLSGVAIYKPVQIAWLKNLLGGYETARHIHFYLTILIVLFFFVHVGQVIKAGWNNFQAMVTGFEIKKESSHD